MHMLQNLFYLTIVLHVSGVTITHLQEHKTSVTTASGNRYNVLDRVKFLLLPIDYIKITIIVDNVHCTENTICSIE
jgi:hypothetical protein